MSGPLNFIVNEFDKNTALFFSKLSGAAYYSPKAFTHFLRKEELVDRFHFEYLDRNGTQAYVLWDDTNFIISFRGTQPKEMKDIFSDMKFWKRSAWEGGRVHTGFANYVDEIWDDVKRIFFERFKN